MNSTKSSATNSAVETVKRPTISEVAKYLRHETSLGSIDRVIVRKANGEIEVRRTFFYRHGGSAEKLAAALEKDLTEKFGANAGFTVKAGFEFWKDWPKESYWTAIIEF